MDIIDKLFNWFKHRAVVVNKNTIELVEEVSIVQKTFGVWWFVTGCSGYRDLFFSVEINKIKNNSCKIVFINKTTEEEEGNRILEKIVPEVKMIKYSDTQNLTNCLPRLDKRDFLRK